MQPKKYKTQTLTSSAIYVLQAHSSTAYTRTFCIAKTIPTPTTTPQLPCVRAYHNHSVAYLVPRLSRQRSCQAEQYPMRRPQRLSGLLLRLHAPLPHAPGNRLRNSSRANPLTRVGVQAGQESPRRPRRRLQEIQEPLEPKTHDGQNVSGEVLQRENLREGEGRGNMTGGGVTPFFRWPLEIS